ncbi:hypothetical protein ACIBG8_25265 [Nonomuraea sp. NPDC050556]|uniref:hypothetical protein n=1 Tax=Nonomuraea sp. NPDC050556 TaxID=3364369 RepID=UPI00379D081A
MSTHPAVPNTVTAAATLWFTAVAAGAFEASIAVSHALTNGAAFSDIAAGLGFRLAVFAGAIFVAVRLRQGHNWARVTLALTLGVFGTLSLVMEPIQWLLAGNSVPEFLAGADAFTLAMTVSRIIHINAVLGAVALMFSPPSNAFFNRLRALTPAA